MPIIVTLSCFSPGSTKPTSLESQAINQKSRDQDSQPQGDAFRPHESNNQESDVSSALGEFLDRPSAHNRTARDVNHPCVAKPPNVKWDNCRKRFVKEVQCLATHVACLDAVAKYYKPLCKTVYGHDNHKRDYFPHKDRLPPHRPNCAPLAIGCQCAA